MKRKKVRSNWLIFVLFLLGSLFFVNSLYSETIESSTISFGCFANNSTHSQSCCQNQGGDHCNSYNEGILTLCSTINVSNISSATISLTNYNTQAYSSRYLDYFISTSANTQTTGVEILSDHEVPGTSTKSEDPLEIDVTSTLKSLGSASTYYFGVLNDDTWEVTVNNIKLVVITGTTTTTTTSIDDGGDKGGLGESCYGDGTCNEGLICVGLICMKCPISSLLGEDDPRLDIIRQFRDEVLAKSAVGKKLIEVYYNNDEKIMEILDEHPTVQRIAKKVLEALVPAMEMLIEVNK